MIEKSDPMERNEARSENRIAPITSAPGALGNMPERIGSWILIQKQKKCFNHQALAGRIQRFSAALVAMAIFLFNPVVVGSALKHHSLFDRSAHFQSLAAGPNQAPCAPIEDHALFKLLTDEWDTALKTHQLPEQSKVAAQKENDNAHEVIKEVKNIEKDIKAKELKVIKVSAAEKETDRETLSFSPYHHIILKTAERYDVDPALIRAVIAVESSNNPTAVSKSGAKGLMQLMPGTAKELGVEDIFNPQSNIEGGTRYLHRMLTRFNGDITLALAAYNAGSRHVLNYGGVPPFKETRRYVKKVLEQYKIYQVEM